MAVNLKKLLDTPSYYQKGEGGERQTLGYDASSLQQAYQDVAPEQIPDAAMAWEGSLPNGGEYSPNLNQEDQFYSDQLGGLYNQFMESGDDTGARWALQQQAGLYNPYKMGQADMQDTKMRQMTQGQEEDPLERILALTSQDNSMMQGLGNMQMIQLAEQMGIDPEQLMAYSQLGSENAEGQQVSLADIMGQQEQQPMEQDQSSGLDWRNIAEGVGKLGYIHPGTALGAGLGAGAKAGLKKFGLTY